MTGRRTITPEELQQILVEHKLWLASDGNEGSRACLRGCDLSKAQLVDKQLMQANLAETDLSSADLTGARLEDADLTNANLHEAKGLTADHLGGADLTGAQLPPHIATFRSLEYVAEASRNARVTFFTLVLVCTYTILVILTTQDHRLITERMSTPIPLVGAEAPIIWFYRLMPVIIVGIYVYLLLYLARLWRRLPALPAKFPDGTALTDTIYPWLFNEQIRQYMPRLQPSRPPSYRFEFILSTILAWFIPPATMIALWWRYLPRRDIGFTVVHTILLFGALLIGTILFAIMVLTLRREIAPMVAANGSRARSSSKIMRQVRVFFIPSGFLLVFIIIIISTGVFRGNASRFGPCTDCVPNLLDFVPNLLNLIGFRAYADLRHENVSRPPSTWNSEDQFLRAVKGADLKGLDLRYADGRGALFVKANLEGADLKEADLREADLRQARILKSCLEGTHLEDADLREAVLVNSVLKGAFLNRAKLQEANLTGADLTGADLRGANLDKSKGLTRAQLETACGDEKTVLPSDLKHFKITPCED